MLYLFLYVSILISHLHEQSVYKCLYFCDNIIGYNYIINIEQWKYDVTEIK